MKGDRTDGAECSVAAPAPFKFRCVCPGYYTDEHLTEALNIERKQPETYNIIYARVSSAKQKTDLERQVSALETFCLGRGLIVGEIIK